MSKLPVLARLRLTFSPLATMPFLALALAGCVTHHAYVDVSSARANLHQIQAAHPPLPVAVQVESLRNGEPYPDNDAALQRQVEIVLSTTGAMQPVSRGARATLKVVADDEYNTGNSALKGVLSGASQGLAGTTVTDDWKFNFTLVGAGIHPYAGEYDHSVLTTFGFFKRAPIAGPAQSEANAFAAVVQQSVIDFLWDWQQAMRDGPTPIEQSAAE